MKAVSGDRRHSLLGVFFHYEHDRLISFENWIKKSEPEWEFSRIAIVGVGIFIQVTVAGLMIAVLSAAGAPPLIYSIGIFLAFMADSIAFGQAPMRWVLGLFAASTVINFLLTLLYLVKLLIG
jgi:hypothetical protein